MRKNSFSTKFRKMKLNRGQLLLHICSLLLLSEVNALSLKKSYEVSHVAVFNKPGKLVEPALRMIGRERVLNGSFIFREDLDDDVKLVLKAFSDGNRNGEYSEMSLQLPVLGVCDSLKKYYKRFVEGSFKTDVHTDFNFMDGNVCPGPKGKYWVKNVILNSDGWLNVLPYGNVKVQAIFMKNNENVGEFEIIVNIERKMFK